MIRRAYNWNKRLRQRRRHARPAVHVLGARAATSAASSGCRATGSPTSAGCTTSRRPAAPTWRCRRASSTARCGSTRRSSTRCRTCRRARSAGRGAVRRHARQPRVPQPDAGEDGAGWPPASRWRRFLKNKGVNLTALTKTQIRERQQRRRPRHAHRSRSAQALLKDTPLWFYILREAELNGGKLKGVGARIVAETFHRAIEGSSASIVRDPAWRPTLGPDVEHVPHGRPAAVRLRGQEGAAGAARLMQRVDVAKAEVEYDETDPEGFRAGMLRFGPQLGAKRTGASVYELPPGQSICPYHYEYGEEEWLLVLEGTAVAAHARGRASSSSRRRRVLPARSGRRAPGPQRHRRDGARADVVDGREPGGDRVPRQRQDRRVHG